MGFHSCFKSMKKKMGYIGAFQQPALKVRPSSNQPEGLGASRMEETIGKAGLRDAAIGTGIAVDKMLALTGQTPALQIVNIPMPSEEERAERKAMHARLDAIFGRKALPARQD